MERLLETEDHEYQIFDGLDLSQKEIKNHSFESCTFVRCQFFEADLSRTEFTDCVFNHCNFGMTKLIDTRLRNAKFEHSKLAGIDFTKCSTSFFELNFKKSLLDTCNFSTLPMKETLFIECIVRACIFGETELIKAVFSDSDLKNSSFHGSDLTEADFSTAKNYFINPKTNTIKDAIFSLPEAVSLLQAFEIKLNR